MELQNISIYWDGVRDIVGVRFGAYRAEEPIAGRTKLNDSDVLALVDAALGEK